MKDTNLKVELIHIYAGPEDVGLPSMSQAQAKINQYITNGRLHSMDTYASSNSFLIVLTLSK